MKKLTNLENKNINLSDKLLLECISTNGARRHLEGVHFHKDGYKVSTDGHRLLRTAWSYSESLKGLTIDPKSMSVIDREFPEIDYIIPKRGQTDSIKVLFQKNQFKSYKRKSNFVFLIKDGDNFKLSLDSENAIACFNYYYLRHLDGEMEVYFKNSLSPFLIDIDKYTDYTVMPCRNCEVEAISMEQIKKAA